MEASQIVNLLRAIAELVESDPQVAKAIEKCLANSSNSHKIQDSSDPKQKKPNPSKILENGDVILAECRQILREQGEEQLRLY